MPMVHLKETLEEYGLRYLHRYNDTEQDWRLNNYFKYLVVRHPFARLVSTWIDQFYVNNVDIRNVGMEGDIEYQDNNLSANVSSIFNKIPTAEDFATFVTKLFQSDNNEQLSSIETLCEPCKVRYDYILRLETMDEDSAEFLSLFGTNLRMDVENVRRETLPIQAKILLPEFTSVPKSDIYKLYEHYSKDFNRFGYDFTSAREVVCNIRGEGGPCC